VLIVILMCILGMGIMLSGNRMPFASFLLGIILTFFLSGKLKKTIFAGFICLIILMQFVFSNDTYIKNLYISFYNNS